MVAVAIEDQDRVPPTERPVAISGVIEQGGFSLFCSRSLRENNSYPAWAAFVDVTGDGLCTIGDAAYPMQLFGWASDVEHEIPNIGWTMMDADAGQPPIGSDAADFCSGYFF